MHVGDGRFALRRVLACGLAGGDEKASSGHGEESEFHGHSIAMIDFVDQMFLVCHLGRMSADDIVERFPFSHRERMKRHFIQENYTNRAYRRLGFSYSRRQKTSHTVFSHGLRFAYSKANDPKLEKNYWTNFSHDPLPFNVNISMKRGTFLKLMPWLNFDFPKWTAEIVPNSGIDDKTFDTEVEYRIGFLSEKDCAIFLLYMESVLAGDTPISYPEEPKRKRLRVV